MSVIDCKWHFWCRQNGQIWCHLHVTLSQCWTKFSNGLVRCSIWIILAKNYETLSKFVKVMRRIGLLVASFFRTRCIVAVKPQIYVFTCRLILPPLGIKDLNNIIFHNVIKNIPFHQHEQWTITLLECENCFVKPKRDAVSAQCTIDRPSL